jgi:glycosyltransferase involved in cell wall biosynthesis
VSTARVAFVADAIYPFNKGGKETRLHEISCRLAARGLEVHVYTMKWWEGGPTIRRDGVWLHAICKHHQLYNGTRRSTKQALLFGVATLCLLTKSFDALDVDHMPFFPLFAARLVCALRRKPMYATWHEVWGREYWRSYMGRLGFFGDVTERLAFRMPHTIISNSQHTTDRLIGKVSPGRVLTVPLGVDFERISAVQPAPSGHDVIFAGRLISHKNVDVLIRSVASVTAYQPQLRCLIIGEGPERDRLEDLSRQLGLTSNIEFRDFLPDQDEVFALMKASRVFVLPSEREGFGAVVLEANACGIPVVTVRHPDNAAQDLIREGENGFLTELNPTELAKTIIRCLDDGLSLCPRETAERYFGDNDWAAVADRIAAIMVGTTDRLAVAAS